MASMKFITALAMGICLLPCVSRAAALNLATLTCEKYENDVLPAAATSTTADSLNTVMWLFGYAVAKSGTHVMYPDALAPFGFALDNECKSNPTETLLAALAIVKPESKKPMDIDKVECASFASKHIQFERTDPESANTIMMWLFGFSVARAGSHLFDAEGVHAFETGLLAICAKHPDISLFDALTPIRVPKAEKAPRP